MSKKTKNKILVIGWDAADWKVINPLIEQGKMPALKSVMDRGVYGNIQTLDPPLSPMLWTSIATGFRADTHGISGFVEPTPDGEGLRPVSSTSRKVKAIWNILNQEGWKSNVVAWWPSNPAEPINGVMVSNLYQVANKGLDEPWEMPKGTVHPEEMSENFKPFRVHPHEITVAMATPFIPALAQNVELRKTQKVQTVLKTISNAATVHAASTYLLAESEWDFMAVYHDAIDHFCHAAMKYYPPRRPEIPEVDYEHFNGVVEAGYRFHDMMLDRILEMVDENTTIVLLSDHGFHSDHQRPLYIPREPSGPAVEHSPYGIFVMAGPGIKKNQSISGASVLDVTPTLLYHAGLPVGKDMEGKVLYQCFENPVKADFIESWEKVEGDSGMHSEEMREDPWAAQEALQQLVELGYIDALDDDKMKEVERCRRENSYYVARNMINGGRYKPAIEILEQIFEESNILRYGQRLAFSYLAKKMYLKCEEVLARLKEIDKEERKKQAEENNSDVFANGEFEEPLYIEYIEGLLNLARNRPRIALPLLEKVQKRNPNNLQLAISIGQIHTLRKNFKAAEKQYINALAIDERSAVAHHGLGMSLLRQKKYSEAVDEFLIALEQDFMQPNVHYHLGESLVKCEMYEDAAHAFQVCIRLTPGMTKAHKWLVEIYEKHLQNPTEAQKSRDFLNNNIKGEITVCSGVDDCDYELFLNALEAAGMQVSKDEEGFQTSMKTLFTDNWLAENKGKIVYVPSRMLNELPANFNYKLIFLDQKLNETVQKRTERIQKKTKKEAVSLGMLNTIEKEKFIIDMWIESQPGQQILWMHWDEILKAPKIQISMLEEFLGIEMNLALFNEIVNEKK